MGRVGERKRERAGGDSRCSLSCLDLKGKEGREEILAPPSERKVDVCVVRRPRLRVRVSQEDTGKVRWHF